MANEVVSAAGRELDLEVRQGVTLGPIPHALVLDDENETPYDLTGYTFSGVVRSYADPTFSVAFDFDISRASEGVYTFGLTDEKTKTLSAGENMFSRRSKHFWQTQMQDAQGRIFPLFYGELRVSPALAPAT